MNEITINGVTYIPRDEATTMKANTEGLRYCIIRTYSAGVHAVRNSIKWCRKAR